MTTTHGKHHTSNCSNNSRVGFFVITNKDKETPDILTTIENAGFINLNTLHALNIATRGAYRKSIKKLSASEKRERNKAYRDAYKNREDVKQRLKEYNSREDVKERKRETQRRRGALVKKLREVDPELFSALMWEDNPPTTSAGNTEEEEKEKDSDVVVSENKPE